MPRAGIDADAVVERAGAIADESGISAVTVARIARDLGVQPPALYKHVDGLEHIVRLVATAAMNQLADELREALQGKARRDAVDALFTVMRRFALHHPGRYAATTGQAFLGQDDPFFVAASRVMASLRAVVGGYGVAEEDRDHAIRMLRCTLHGYASLQAGNGFQWDAPVEDTLRWTIDFMDRGLSSYEQGAARSRA